VLKSPRLAMLMEYPECWLKGLQGPSYDAAPQLVAVPGVVGRLKAIRKAMSSDGLRSTSLKYAMDPTDAGPQEVAVIGVEGRSSNMQ